MGILRELIPEDSVKLVKYSAQDLVDRLGRDIIAGVVESILCGGNYRDLTEGLTQRRILLMNASLLTTYLKALNSIEDFQENISHIIKSELGVARLKKKHEELLILVFGINW